MSTGSYILEPLQISSRDVTKDSDGDVVYLVLVESNLMDDNCVSVVFENVLLVEILELVDKSVDLSRPSNTCVLPLNRIRFANVHF